MSTSILPLKPDGQWLRTVAEYIEREIVKELGVCDRRQGKHDKACIYFEKGSIFRFLCCEVPHVSNILVMDHSNGSFRGKKIVAAPFY